MNHQIHVSEYAAPVKLADGSGVLCQSKWAVSRLSRVHDSAPNPRFSSVHAALKAANRVIARLAREGHAATIHIHSVGAA